MNKTQFFNLLHHIDPEFEDEVNIVEQSRYYRNNTIQNNFGQTKNGTQILNLNCGGLPSKCNRFKMFLASYNDIPSPVSVITIQETHFTHNADPSFYELVSISFGYCTY